MTTIASLSSASSVAAADLFVVSQGGTDKKVTHAVLASFATPVTLSGAAGGLTFSPRSGSGNYQWYNNDGTDIRLFKSTDIFSIADGGMVNIQGAGGGITIKPRSSTGNFVLYNSAGTSLAIYNGSSDVVTISSAGAIKSVPLAGSGNRAVYSDSTGILTNSSSDARLKTNIAHIGSREALDLVVTLEPVRYNWIDTDTRGAQREIGLIAQQVQSHVPEVVGTNSDGTLSLDYPKLTALLIGAVQELAAKIAVLEAAR